MTVTTKKQHQLRLFEVRDISKHYDSPTFDILYHNTDNCVIRYSEAVWDTFEQAAIVADRYESEGAHPEHWDVYKD